jgi:hypothetical protein
MTYSRHSIAEMRELARHRGGTCLSKRYVNSHTCLLWRCAHGHQWEALPSTIIRGSWCAGCAGVLKLNLQIAREFAHKRKGFCLSTVYENNRQLLKWECKKGHVWEATMSNLSRGEWCPVCNGMKKLTLELLQRVAAARGGLLLSRRYARITEKLLWQCSARHQWTASANQVKNAGTWCPICANINRKGANSPTYDIQDMQRLAHARGGQCLSKHYLGMHTPLLWKCRRGHEWSAVPHSVRRGHWCLRCSIIKKIRNPRTRMKYSES